MTNELHVVTGAFGYSGKYIAQRLLDAGHEVITTSNTFIATAEAISYTGATPVFVDIDPATGNIVPQRIEAAITRATRAIIPVHLYGRPADLNSILKIVDAHHVPVIVDACKLTGKNERADLSAAPEQAGARPRAAARGRAPGVPSRSATS